jgi:type IV secretion system protein VirB10
MTQIDPAGLDARPAEDDPPLDRAISPIAGRLGSGRTGKAMVFAALLAGCAAFALVTWKADRPKPERAPAQPARQVVAFEPTKAPPPTLAAPGPGAPALTGGPGPGGVVPALAVDGAPPATGAAAAQAQAARAAELRTVRGAPILAWSRTGVAAGLAPAAGPALAAAAEQAPTELDQLRRGSALGGARAQQLGDRSFLILAGTTIPCILQTAMDSATAGYVTCVIPSDVLSDNGAVVLLEKGSRVLGEYRSGMRQGQRRLFVLWTRAVTPNGVAIALASPASDALGRAGFDGDIDTHFWDRFGGALLLSIVDDGAYALAGRDSHGDAARLPSDAAGVALQGSVDIPPTLRKAQGAEVAILAAQDFDFSGVYGLKARRP